MSKSYHPLLLFNDEGECRAAKLRPGNVHSADGWEELPHARYYWLLLAESHLTRRVFGGMLGKVATLPSPAG